MRNTRRFSTEEAFGLNEGSNSPLQDGDSYSNVEGGNRRNLSKILSIVSRMEGAYVVSALPQVSKSRSKDGTQRTGCGVITALWKQPAEDQYLRALGAPDSYVEDADRTERDISATRSIARRLSSPFYLVMQPSDQGCMLHEYTTDGRTAIESRTWDEIIGEGLSVQSRHFKSCDGCTVSPVHVDGKGMGDNVSLFMSNNLRSVGGKEMVEVDVVVCQDCGVPICVMEVSARDSDTKTMRRSKIDISHALARSLNVELLVFYVNQGEAKTVTGRQEIAVERHLAGTDEGSVYIGREEESWGPVVRESLHIHRSQEHAGYASASRGLPSPSRTRHVLDRGSLVGGSNERLYNPESNVS